ncbi:MAG: hypothetical protein ACM3NN_08010 [Nitrospirota bacterium]|jgi:hypothetical protein
MLAKGSYVGQLDRYRLFASVISTVIAFILIRSVIVSSIVIGASIAAIFAVHVFAIVVRSVVVFVPVITGAGFLLSVCMLQQRSGIRLLSDWRFPIALGIRTERMDLLYSARGSKNTE